MKIDIHTHIMPDKTPDWYKKFGYGDFIRLEHHQPCCAKMYKGDTMFREIEHNCWDAGVRIQDMDNTDVDIQVLSTIPVLFNYWANPHHALETSRFFNDHIAETVAAYPQRFIGLGTVPLQNVDLAIKELERLVNELKMPGIQIGSNVNQKNLGDSSFFPFWEAVQSLDACVFIHPWEMMGTEHIKKYWLPWLVGMPAETSRAICSLIFGGVFKHFSQLRIAFAHGGGSFPSTIGRIEHGFNVRPDLCAIDNEISPRDYIGRFWIDSLVHDADALDFIVKIMGEDKICLGSDYPFPLGEHHPGKLIEQYVIEQQLREKLLFKNAIDWLGDTIFFEK